MDQRLEVTSLIVLDNLIQQLKNETVSLGDTATSLHTPAPTLVGVGGGGVLQTNSSSKCQDLPKFSFLGEVLKTNIPEILQLGHSRNLEPKILATGMLSHSTCVETNKFVSSLACIFVVFNSLARCQRQRLEGTALVTLGYHWFNLFSNLAFEVKITDN